MNESFLQTLFDIWRILTQGGWVMGAIFLAGQLGWFLILERWWHYRKMDGHAHRFLVQSQKSGDPVAALETAHASRGLFGQVVEAVRGARSGGQEAMIM